MRVAPGTWIDAPHSGAAAFAARSSRSRLGNIASSRLATIGASSRGDNSPIQEISRLLSSSRLPTMRSRLVAGIVVEIFLELAFDDAALFLDDEDLRLLPDELQRVATRQRPHHADLVDVDAKLAAGGFVEAEQAQRFHQVEMALAGGDDAEGGVGNVVDAAVDRVGFGEGEDRHLLRLHPLLDLRAGQVRPAIVQAGRRAA